jgi:hypothetical protein
MKEAFDFRDDQKSQCRHGLPRAIIIVRRACGQSGMMQAIYGRRSSR